MDKSCNPRVIFLARPQTGSCCEIPFLILPLPMGESFFFHRLCDTSHNWIWVHHEISDCLIIQVIIYCYYYIEAGLPSSIWKVCHYICSIHCYYSGTEYASASCRCSVSENICYLLILYVSQKLYGLLNGPLFHSKPLFSCGIIWSVLTPTFGLINSFLSMQYVLQLYICVSCLWVETTAVLLSWQYGDRAKHVILINVFYFH